MSRLHLKYARMVSFGSAVNRTIGPFEPGLNVVFGRNEAGKTTLASFIEGLMFGWEEARGTRNTYKPDNAERAGSLFFADEEGHERELSRIRNVDGLKGDASLVADIDRDTFRTMFFLTSDELRSLRNAPNLTARLLTAGAGTSMSPALALGQVSERLAGYTSRAASAQDSLTKLGARREELRLKLRAIGDEMDELKRLDAEFHEMEEQRKEIVGRLSSLNDEMERLAVCRARIDRLEVEEAQLTEDLRRTRREEAEVAAELGLAGLDAAELRTAGLGAAEPPCENRGEGLEASIDRGASRGEEAGFGEEAGRRGSAALCPATPVVLYVIAALLAALLVAAGASLIFTGQSTGEASFAGIGAALLLAACALLGAVFAFSLSTQRKMREAAEARAVEQSLQAQAQRERALRESGRRQHALTLAQRCDELRDRVRELEAQRMAALERAGLPADADLDELDFELARRSRDRAALTEELEEFNAAYGETRQRLAQALDREDFADAKIEYQAVRTKLLDATQDFMRLLLAKRMLERAIAEWELESQPAVYREAGRLLSLMTEGAWTRVIASSDGGLMVGNEERRILPAQKLSLGTCQQLYLSMRIALLMASDELGRSVPVIADDILVNFDSERRHGAARALAELARVRQVIVLTCHEELVEVFMEAEPQARVIRLDR